MNWPFVSRALYEAVVEANGRLIDENRRKSEVNASLVERLLTLKMQGAVEVPKVETPPLATFTPQPPDPLRELIAEKCGRNYALRSIMLRQLSADRAARVPEDAIRAAIMEGVSSDGVP